MSRGWDANGLRRANVPGGKGSRRFPGSLPSLDRDTDGIRFNRLTLSARMGRALGPCGGPGRTASGLARGRPCETTMATARLC